MTTHPHEVTHEIDEGLFGIRSNIGHFSAIEPKMDCDIGAKFS